jgi:hypothetical protein
VVGDAVLDLALEEAPGDVDRSGQRALLVLVGLPHVEDDGVGARGQRRLGPGGVDLPDLGLRLGEQLAEAGHGSTSCLGGWTGRYSKTLLHRSTFRARGDQAM